MQHHPDYQWLEQYAAGTLPLPLSIGISSHLSFCASCRADAHRFQTVGAQVIKQLVPAVAVADDAFSRLMATIDHAPIAASESIKTESLMRVDGVPNALRKLIPNGFDALNWRRVLPSLRVADIGLSDDRYQVALHRINIGGRVYEHDHGGDEFTLVLQGSFSDDFGYYSDGDFICRQPNERHTPTAAQNEECIVLTIQAAPVKFTGFFTRWLNPFVK